MSSLVDRFWDWVGRLFGPAKIGFRTTDDPPEVIEPNVVYLIGDVGSPWSAAMQCPCHCGEAIHLSLVRRDRPSWRAHCHVDGTISLSPSVWRTKGCKSHFFVRHGRIIWAREDAPMLERHP